MEKTGTGSEKGGFRFWSLLWGLGLAGQLCWNMENQWFNTFVYAKIARDPTIISWMTAISAAATTLSTFLFGTVTDRKGRRRIVVALGYILWGVFTILFGLTEFITGGSPDPTAAVLLTAGTAAVAADAIMSFFGSMGNDSGLNAWANDHMTDKNRGQVGAAMAVQPVIGTIVGTVLGGLLIGQNDNYLRLFVVMGGAVILFGIAALLFMKDSPTLTPNVTGSFWRQFFSIFNFKRYFSLRELVFVNLTLTVYFVAFNMYFSHLGNFMIYYLGFTADTMGLVEGVALAAAMLFVIPATALINRDRSPLLCALAVVVNFIGVLLIGLFVTPASIDHAQPFSPLLLIPVFLIGLGYILILQTLTVWSKQLYPKEARGQFEGIRILFFVLLPMCIAPLIANPIIKASGQFVNEYGLTEYLPTNTLFLVAAGLVLLTFLPLIPASRLYRARLKSAAEQENG